MQMVASPSQEKFKTGIYCGIYLYRNILVPWCSVKLERKQVVDALAPSEPSDL